MSTPGPAPTRRRAATIFVFVTVLLDMLALGMIIPVLPILIEEFRGGDTALAARTVGLFGFVWAGVQIFASPILGSLSDRYGRRPVILLSNFGLGLDYCLMALAPSLGWLLAGRVLSGVTSASAPTAFAYVADVTEPGQRPRAYGLLGAAFGMGFILGPALGGMLGTLGPRTPFWAAAGFSLANAMYGLLILPESHPPNQRVRFSWRRANPLGSLSLLRSHPQLLGLASLHFLYNLAHHALSSVFVLYAEYRFGWNTAQIGGTLAAVGVGFAVVQGGLVAPIVSRIGERRALMTGLLAGAVGFVVYGLAPTGRWFLLGIPIMAFWSLFGPSAQAMMTRRVGRGEQGALQGALASVRMSTGLVGPVLFSQTFSLFIGALGAWHLPGAPYLLAAALLLLALAIARPVTKSAWEVDRSVLSSEL